MLQETSLPLCVPSIRPAQQQQQRAASLFLFNRVLQNINNPSSILRLPAQSIELPRKFVYISTSPCLAGYVDQIDPFAFPATEDHRMSAPGVLIMNNLLAPDGMVYNSSHHHPRPFLDKSPTSLSSTDLDHKPRSIDFVYRNFHYSDFTNPKFHGKI